MKKLILLLTLALVQLTHANTSAFDEITVIGRLEGHGDSLKVIRTVEGDALQGMFEKKQIEKDLSSLQKGEEVLLKGYVTYPHYPLEGVRLPRPIFVIQSVQPISLERLGKMDDLNISEPLTLPVRRPSYAPMAIPVSAEVASSLTLTSSILLLQSLTAGPNDPQLRQQLNSGIIIFAGALATGLFIYEQISAKPKSK